jgi:hypothetical protein
MVVSCCGFISQAALPTDQPNYNKEASMKVTAYAVDLQTLSEHLAPLRALAPRTPALGATEKVVHSLGHRPCRSATHCLVRLYLVSMVEHAKAWLSDDRKALGRDWRVLSDLTKITRRANREPATG